MTLDWQTVPTDLIQKRRMIMHDELTQVDIDKMKEELQHRIQVLRPQLIE